MSIVIQIVSVDEGLVLRVCSECGASRGQADTGMALIRLTANRLQALLKWGKFVIPGFRLAVRAAGRVEAAVAVACCQARVRVDKAAVPVTNTHEICWIFVPRR